MSTVGPIVYWDISRTVNSNGRKQLMLVQLAPDSTDSEITTISTSDKNLTVYYVAKDILSSITDNLSIPEEYHYNMIYYIYSKLYADLDDDKAWKNEKRFEGIIKDAKKEAASGSLEGGITMIPYEF